MIALFAFFNWLAGHAIWRVRRMLGGAKEAKPFDHQLRDHLANAFPRLHDGAPAPVSANACSSMQPAWMKNRWL
jgi:hypothetical protein